MRTTTRASYDWDAPVYAPFSGVAGRTGVFSTRKSAEVRRFHGARVAVGVALPERARHRVDTATRPKSVRHQLVHCNCTASQIIEGVPLRLSSSSCRGSAISRSELLSRSCRCISQIGNDRNDHR